MPYLTRTPRRHATRYGTLSGLGEFNDESQCSTIPIGDPYRRPGNYCATPDGGTTTFNADGTTYRAPGAVDPDPAHPAGARASGSGSFLDSFLRALTPAPPIPGGVPVVPPGMSTTTKVALIGGAALLVLMIARR